jgi:hypothetical protein
MTPEGRAATLRIGHATAARRARQRTAGPPGNASTNFVTAPTGDEADGPHSQRLYDHAMEENHGMCD